MSIACLSPTISLQEIVEMFLREPLLKYISLRFAAHSDAFTWQPHEAAATEVSFVSTIYLEISNIIRTKSQNLNVSRVVLQLSLCNLLTHVSSR